LQGRFDVLEQALNLIALLGTDILLPQISLSEPDAAVASSVSPEQKQTLNDWDTL
jgi:hypothetical protein